MICVRYLRSCCSFTAINLPPSAIDTFPVSSETTIVIASVISLIPIAARCLEPYRDGISAVVGGKYALAHAILSPWIITAPSCSGVEVTKMEVKSSAVTSEFKRVPVAIKSSRG